MTVVKIYPMKRGTVNYEKMEDEFQIVFKCQNYQSIRNDANIIYLKNFEMTLVTVSKQNLLSYVTSSIDSVLINLFSKFIVKCFIIGHRSL